MPRCSLLLWITLLTSSIACGQSAQATFDPVPSLPFHSDDPLTLRGPALPSHPFTVTGRSGAILGMQDGEVELWEFPVKFFSALHLRAEIEGYPVPIELNPLAAELEVAPDHTTLTYGHAAITVRQHMFVPTSNPDNPTDPDAGRGGQIIFEIHAVRPATLTVSLTPAMVAMWPAPQWGSPGWGWRSVGTGGVYTVATDNPHVFGMIGMPEASPGEISPYQEHPHTLPLEFKVHFDPTRDEGKMFPLVCELARAGESSDEAGTQRMEARLLTTERELPAIFARTRAYYAHFFDHRTVAHTPDPRFDAALQWAELAIETSQATIPATASKPAETGLVAGWYPSFDSARPGFGWFFGRDTLWSMYAIDSYGDRALARRAFTFLIRRQRADGKMPHEYSQTAGDLTGSMAWNTLPYEYAAADGTPLFLLAMRDYVQASGDLDFLKQNWDAVEKAFRFERTHDSDGDGVYDNSQGTGWVEDWPVLPHQELYLAALDRSAMAAMVTLATWTGHSALATEAGAVVPRLDQAVAAYRGPDGLFAFSRNQDGSYDRTQTVYPTVALWWRGDGLPAAEPQLEAWASHRFATDWGMRAVSSDDRVFDPMSYHRGTVWPLFTGWTAAALYRTGHPLAGYLTLRRNVDLTWTQDPGAVTELLSGEFFEPLGRSTTHQLWSSAMVLAPAMRDLFGLEPDAPNHTIYLHPHLPPVWNDVTLEHVRVGTGEWTLRLQRQGAQLVASAQGATAGVLCLRAGSGPAAEETDSCHESPAREHRLSLPLPAVELFLPGQTLPEPGDRTAQPHVLSETAGTRSAELLLEAPADSAVELQVVRNGGEAHNLHVQGGELREDRLQVTMPGGSGWVRKAVTVRW